MLTSDLATKHPSLAEGIRAMAGLRQRSSGSSSIGGVTVQVLAGPSTEPEVKLSHTINNIEILDSLHIQG